MVVGDFVTEADVVIVGAGPGGYVAAVRAAQLGKSVLLIDKGEAGGVCLHRGCIPSKTLISAAHQFEQARNAAKFGVLIDHVRVDFSKVQGRKTEIIQTLADSVKSLLKSNRVQTVQGEAYFVNENTISVVNGEETARYKFNHCIIATGSRPMEWKTAPFKGRILSSTEALALQEIPKSLIVVGGGYIGIELGQMYAKLGTQVHIIEGASSILPSIEHDISRFVNDSLRKLGVHVHTNATVEDIKQSEHGAVVHFTEQGQAHVAEAEYALISIGRRPNTDDLGLEQINLQMTKKGHIVIDRSCRTSISGIYAIGDVVDGPALAHKASYEGKVAAETIAGLSSAIIHQSIPAVVFSDPEIATAGLSRNAAAERGIPVIVGKSWFKANGRAISMHEQEGFAMLVADGEKGTLLGAQIVGPGASDLIAVANHAIEMGSTLEDLSLTVHAHPTLSEIWMEAAEHALRRQA